MGTASPAGRAPDFEAVLAARERIAPFVHRTPLLTSRHLGAVHGARILLKAENLQRAGAFKIRGALNALLAARERGQMPPAGAVAYSSGNHGQAVALAAGIVGVRASIVVPEDILPAKRAAIEGYGAEVIPCGRTSEDRRIGALEIARERGALVVPPYDHPLVIAGQGTVALEIFEDAPELDAILVPVGGGGLISGISIVAKALRPGLRVVGAEPERGNDFQLSLAAGRRVSVPPPETIADGLRAVVPGELTFPIVQRLVDEIWTASDASIREAQRALLERRAS
ncbi:MAG: threonine/serine dehydratase [Planctomycetota bacterium]